MTRVVPAAASAIEAAATCLRRGGLVAFPTETVYGLGAVATNDAAVARVFEAKGRPANNPLIVHVADVGGARALTMWNDRAAALAQAFWPGALTLVLPISPGAPLSPLVTAGLATVAVRVPAAPVALQLLSETLLPVAAPSANASGHVSPTTAQHVEQGLGDRVDVILDGGPATIGVESTVVDLHHSASSLLRPGGVSRADIEALIGPLDRPGADGALRSPGQLAVHYAPSRPVRLEVERPGADEAFLAFGPMPAAGTRCLNLSPKGDLAEAARNLYAMLRALDRDDVSAIAVAPLPKSGLGEALNDRLARAAAGR